MPLTESHIASLLRCHSAVGNPGKKDSDSTPLLVYTACERAFSDTLSPLHKFLTFEENYQPVLTWWNGLDTEGKQEERKAQEEIAKLGAKAYLACKGRSYGRIDIRQNESTGQYHCLEVNSLPGISAEIDSSVGFLNREHSRVSFAVHIRGVLAEQTRDQLLTDWRRRDVDPVQRGGTSLLSLRRHGGCRGATPHWREWRE